MLAHVAVLTFILGISAKYEREYAVVIEAAAHGTFGSCYSWARRNMTGDPITEFEVLGRQTIETEPLHYYANVARLGEIKKQIQPIVDFCISQIPKESLEYSPIFALLGGGVRSLNSARRGTVATVVHQVLRLSCFKWGPQNETVIELTARQQAAYAYTGVNWINGRVAGSALPQLLVDLTAGTVATSAGAGGDPANQLTLRTLDGSTTVDVPLLDLTHLEELRKYLRAVDFGAARRQEWPCLPAGYETTMTVIKRDGLGYDYDVVGTSDAAACETILQASLADLLAAVPSTAPSRTLPAGVYGVLGALEQGVLAALPGVSDTDPVAYLTAARALCGRSWPELLARAGDGASEEAVAEQCQIALWTSLVLRDAYGAGSDVKLNAETATRAFRSGAAPGFILDKVSTLPVGAPPRGVRCEELRVDLLRVEPLPRTVMYQCDCLTFHNYQNAVHYISSDPLLREVMPQFATAFLFPEKFAAMDPVKYPSEYRVCTSTSTKPGKYTYSCDVHENEGMVGTIVIREQRMFGED